MIRRIWHGWTNFENAKSYQDLLLNEVFAHIEGRRIKGFHGIELIKRISNNEVEFVTMMMFENLEAVKEFAGDDYEKAVVPNNARQLLTRYDDRSQHYEVIEYKN